MSAPLFFDLDDRKVEEFVEKEGVEIKGNAFREQAILAVIRRRVWEELDRQTDTGDKRSYVSQMRNQFLGVLQELGLVEGLHREEDDE